MVLLTKDLFINLLLIIILCFLGNILKGYFEENISLKRWLNTTVGAVAIILSITMGNEFLPGFIFDLRQIPYIILSLVEGPFVSIVLFVITITTRSFYGGYGIIVAIITYSLTTLFSIKLGPMYVKGGFSRKLLITLSLSFLCSLGHLIAIPILGHSRLDVTFLSLIYLLVPAMGMIIVLAFSEGIRRYFLLKKELFKVEKAQVVSHLAASFGHEVRNPITATRGFLQLLLDEEVSPDKRIEYAKIAIHELDHAESIIHSYLTFAKPHIQKREIFDLREETNEVVKILSPLANMNNVVVNYAPQDDSLFNWVLDGERKLFHQCLLNIVKNAIEAMPQGGMLTLALYSVKEHIGIRITDTGNGMTKDQIKRLGEPYFSTKEKGTGLGMMVVYSIVKSLQGRIEVESEARKGTTVTLLFPLFHQAENQNSFRAMPHHSL